MGAMVLAKRGVRVWEGLAYQRGNEGGFYMENKGGDGETITALLRHPDYWISGYSSVDVKESLNEGKKKFDKLSVEALQEIREQVTKVSPATFVAGELNRSSYLSPLFSLHQLLIKMFPRRSKGEELEYPFFEGDGSSFDEWRDYGVAGDDYEGPSIFDDDQFEDELEMGDDAFC
nr:cyclic nucleotide-binding domain-containing protein [Tanacetum cinerariifolium]